MYEQQVEDLSAIIPSKTPNATQRNYKMLCNFPFCPPSVDGDPIAAYKRRLGPGNVFVACEYFISACYSRTMSEDGSSLYVISESQGRIKYWGLAKITYENGQFVHESLGVFLEMQGAEHRLSEVQGFEWTGGSQEDEIPEMAEVPDLIPSKTPGAVQRNWKTLSEFPACPQDYSGMPLEAYAGRLAVGSTFCRNEQYSATVFKAGISLDRKSLCVITEPETAGGGSIKPFALTAITYENGMFVHESKGTFFEQNSAEKHFSLALGQEWTGGEGIDDYC